MCSIGLSTATKNSQQGLNLGHSLCLMMMLELALFLPSCGQNDAVAMWQVTLKILRHVIS